MCLLGLCLGGDWAGRASFNIQIKLILWVSRKKKRNNSSPCWPIQKSPFFVHNKTKEVIFILEETAETTWKVLLPRIFLQGRCTLHPNDARGLVFCAVSLLQRRMGCISPELQMNKLCPPATFSSGWSACPSDPATGAAAHHYDALAFVMQNSLAIAISDSVPLSFISLSGCKTHVAKRHRRRFKGALSVWNN